MGKQKQPIMIIGEGITEFYYFNSLKDRFRDIQIEPTFPKHSTSIKELGNKIEEGIANGYAKIYCVIDMDNKDKAKEKEQYLNLKQKYSKPIDKPKKGIHCEIKFFETHRCTELFFLYYFTYTSKPYENQEDLIKDINTYCEYKKEMAFFKKGKGLHSYFEKKGGSIDTAMANAERSCKENEQTGRSYTYTELGEMINCLINNKKR